MDTSMQGEYSEEIVSFSDIASNCFVKASKGIFVFLLPCLGRKTKKLAGGLEPEFVALGSLFGFRKFGHD